MVSKNGLSEAVKDRLELELKQGIEMIEYLIHDLKTLVQSAESTGLLVCNFGSKWKVRGSVLLC